VALWNDRLEDDGAAYASEAALRPIADAVVWDAVRALRRAFCEGNVERQWQAQALLELARLLRMDLQSGAWGRLEAGERRQLRQALITLSQFAHAPAPIPIA
jgi:gamma-glutamylcysteine synthetase